MFDSEKLYEEISVSWKVYQYDFIFSEDDFSEKITDAGFALPNSQIFWDDFFKNTTEWGMYLYNQDWLNRELEVIPQMQEDPYLAHNWLKNMSIGAEKHDIKILYCMPLFRHLLESVEFPSVTQMRSSGDYQPSDRIPNWRVGISNIWSIGLNLTPNKDVFWTSEVEENSHEYNSDVERNPALQTALAVLSAGVVGPGDGPGFENEELIMSTCRSDGLLLTPQFPLTMPHSQFIYNV